MKCSYGQCENEATLQIGFKAWAVGHFKKHAPLEAFIGIGVCDECSEYVKAKDFLPPENIAMINNKLTELRRAPIDPATAELTLEPIIDGKLRMPYV